MRLNLLSRVRAYLARRRALRKRKETYILFTRLPREMQSDLLRPKMFENAEDAVLH